MHLCACICVCVHAHESLFPHRPGEGVTAPGTEVGRDCECWKLNSASLKGQNVFLTTEHPFPPCEPVFLVKTLGTNTVFAVWVLTWGDDDIYLQQLKNSCKQTIRKTKEGVPNP